MHCDGGGAYYTPLLRSGPTAESVGILGARTLRIAMTIISYTVVGRCAMF